MTQKNSTPAGRNRMRIIVIFALLFACGPALFFIPNFENEENLIILLTLLPFIAVGLGLFIYALVRHYSRALFGKPEIIISQETLRLGESFNVSLRHTFKRDVLLDHITLQYLFRETATYQQGTDTRTVTHNEIIENHELPGGQYRTGQFIQQAYDLQIPADGMHTLVVERNKLQWFIRLEAGISNLPDFVEEYELTVLPQRIEG